MKKTSLVLILALILICSCLCMTKNVHASNITQKRGLEPPEISEIQKVFMEYDSSLLKMTKYTKYLGASLSAPYTEKNYESFIRILQYRSIVTFKIMYPNKKAEPLLSKTVCGRELENAYLDFIEQDFYSSQLAYPYFKQLSEPIKKFILEGPVHLCSLSISAIIPLCIKYKYCTPPPHSMGELLLSSSSLLEIGKINCVNDFFIIEPRMYGEDADGNIYEIGVTFARMLGILRKTKGDIRRLVVKSSLCRLR